jgi:NitT/TauT family transport system permease protein
MAVDALDEQLAGLDALESTAPGGPSKLRAAWSATWPKLAAIAISIGIWQLVVMSGWKPEYILPSPFTALDRLWHDLGTERTWNAIGNTLRRAGTGFAVSLVIGGLIGIVVSSSKLLRSAIGSLITGLQTMPSIAWFPLALVLFEYSERAILFVMIIGAAPSIANGLIGGIDHIPPLWRRAGRVLGATGFNALRYVILPAALPSFVSGLKQGWAFAWRSLMAGELLVIIAKKHSIGSELDFARQNADYPEMMATMLLILVLGILIDTVAFGRLERGIRRRRGLLET